MDDLVKMARLAQRDDRMATGALYRDLADRIEADAKRIAELEAENDELDFLRHEGGPDSVAALEMKAARAEAAEAENARLREALRLIELIGYREGEDFGWVNAHMRGVSTSALSGHSIEHYWRLFPKHRAALATEAGK